MEKKLRIAYVVLTTGEGFYQLADYGNKSKSFEDASPFIHAKKLKEALHEDDLMPDCNEPIFAYSSQNKILLSKSHIVTIEIINNARMTITTIYKTK